MARKAARASDCAPTACKSVIGHVALAATSPACAPLSYVRIIGAVGFMASVPVPGCSTTDPHGLGDVDDGTYPEPPSAVFCADPLPTVPLASDIADMLRAVPGIEAITEGSPTEGARFFRLTFRQLVDHSAPGGVTFRQRVSVIHRDTTKPTVLGTQGYDLEQQPFFEEPTEILGGNQIEVEHRFFAQSHPDSPDWSRLTIWQAAADHDCVTRALRIIYTGAWVATGRSKGGMAAVYFRRFFPNDVEASIAYVAPLSFGAPDSRYIEAVEEGKNAECRTTLRAFQRLAFSRRVAMVSRMLAIPGAKFNRLGVDEAFEHLVLELPFNFWAYRDASYCPEIPYDAPATDAGDDRVFAFLDGFGGVVFYSDAFIEYIGAYYVQSANQLGYPAIDEANVADLVNHAGTDRSETYVPAGVSTKYQPGAMLDIDAWVRTDGERLLFIYGQSDPWSAGMFQLGAARDSFRFVVSGGNHGSLIGNLATSDQETALDALRRWTGVATRTMAKSRTDNSAVRWPRLPETEENGR